MNMNVDNDTSKPPYIWVAIILGIGYLMTIWFTYELNHRMSAAIGYMSEQSHKALSSTELAHIASMNSWSTIFIQSTLFYLAALALWALLSVIANKSKLMRVITEGVLNIFSFI